MTTLGRTPKVFGSSYQPPKPVQPLNPIISKSWKAVLIVVIIFGVIFLIGRLPIFQLKTIELTGGNDEAINTGLNGLKNKPIFSRTIANFVTETRQEARVASFDCRRGLPNSLKCNLALRTPELVWQSAEQSYLVDKQGVVYAAKTGDQPGLITVTDTKNPPLNLGMTVASSEIITQYAELLKLLKDQGLTVTGLQLDETLYQITAVLDRSGKSPIQALFLLSEDLSSQVTAVATTLSQKGDSITAYIDARVPGYVYTK